jgi:prepilin-type N-terminal cleavage/methylation domain-containing protein
MKRNQSGFTLIEIAIVLVIIGLLLGGVMKGQELINSAKVKNLAGDFKNTSLYIYSYQDKYRALPGDDALASTHVTLATKASDSTPPGDLGNGVVNGKWDSSTATDESFLFWEHVRLSGITTGVTDKTDTSGYPQRNTLGGLIGITNASATANPITGLKGSYLICSGNIQGKFAKQLDVMLDDGKTDTGSMRTQSNNAGSAWPAGTIGKAATATPEDTELFTVCMGV